MEVLNLLKTLTSTPGPSGFETDIATVIADIWKQYADDVSIDKMGNVIAVKHGRGEPRHKLLLSAHMDEIALMVTAIEEHNGYGFLKVINIGGVDRRQVLAQRVTVHGRKQLVGVTSALPWRMLPSDQHGRARTYDSLLVDMGLSAETTRQLVRVGDFVTFDQPVHQLQSGNVATKALDNRSCVATLTVALQYLQTRQHDWDIIFAATIQEETRLLGGSLVSFSQQPDVAIALDVSHAKQPGVGDAGAQALGSGPILDIGVNVHPGIYTALQKTASDLEMKVNVLAHARSSGTEAATLQLARAGVPTGLISLPIRYMHTMVETVALKDMTRAGRLIGEFAATRSADFLNTLQKAYLP